MRSSRTRSSIVASLFATLAVATPLAAQNIQLGPVTIFFEDTTALTAPQRTLLRLEMSRNRALYYADTVMLKTLYAPDFRGITSIGAAVTRAQLFEGLGTDDPSQRSQIDEVAIRVLDAAQTSAMMTARVRILIGTKTLSITRYLQVYQLRQGRWQIVAAHATSIVAR